MGNIMLATFAGMSLMMLGIAIGLPIIANMALLMGAIYLVIKMRSGKAAYTVNEKGVQWQQKSHYKKIFTTQFFPWEKIKSYTRGTDRTRSMEEYDYIKIYVEGPPGKLVFNTQRGDKKKFKEFVAAFEMYVEQKNTSPATTLSSRKGNYAKSASKGSKKKVVQKKNFYQTFFAKLLTLFFMALTLVFLYIWITGGLSFTNLFRVFVIIIPGTLYMTKKVFFSKKG